MGIVEDVSNNKAQLLDVRTDDEWDTGHALGAKHIPLQELSNSDNLLSKDLAVYVYCASGNRAGKAVEYLIHAGFKAINIGGLSDWRESGGQISY